MRVPVLARFGTNTPYLGGTFGSLAEPRVGQSGASLFVVVFLARGILLCLPLTTIQPVLWIAGFACRRVDSPAVARIALSEFCVPRTGTLYAKACSGLRAVARFRLQSERPREIVAERKGMGVR